MRRTILLIMAACLTGCATELTVIAGPMHVNGEVEPGVSMSVMQPFSKHGICGWSHSSDPSDGLESGEHQAKDILGCGFRVGGNGL